MTLTTPLKLLLRILLQPRRDATAFPTAKAYQDSVKYITAFRRYAREKLCEWERQGHLIARDCPLCASRSTRPRLTTPEGVQYVCCDSCGFVFMNPAPSRPAYNRMYESSYDGLLAEWEHLKEENGLSEYLTQHYFGLDVIRRYRTGGKFLDYGCGSGWILRLAMQHYDVTGMDIDRNQLARIREHLHIDSLIEGDITHGLPRANHGVFDVIHSNQNLEHMLEPRVCVAEWFKGLKKGGILFIACPNIDSFAFEVLGGQNSMAAVSHVSLFGPRTIRNLLESEGFAVEEVKSYDLDLRSVEYWQYKLRCGADFEHRHSYYACPKTMVALGYPLWMATEVYFLFQMIVRLKRYGNYLYCVARKS